MAVLIRRSGCGLCSSWYWLDGREPLKTWQLAASQSFSRHIQDIARFAAAIPSLAGHLEPFGDLHSEVRAPVARLSLYQLKAMTG